jgi:hypothetical protein
MKKRMEFSKAGGISIRVWVSIKEGIAKRIIARRQKNTFS